MIVDVNLPIHSVRGKVKLCQVTHLILFSLVRYYDRKILSESCGSLPWLFIIATLTNGTLQTR